MERPPLEERERIAEFVRRYLAGEKPVDIAREYGVSANTVHTILRRLGAKL